MTSAYVSTKKTLPKQIPNKSQIVTQSLLEAAHQTIVQTGALPRRAMSPGSAKNEVFCLTGYRW